ncbi:MAG: DNA-binding protein WhiA [Clostridia bacterium]|nr:DNA-binding protein WhiA [Clostridia bacterium]
MASFSSQVKKELSEINNLSNKELVKAELMGYITTNSSKKFSTSSQYNINRYSKLLNNIGENDFSISIKGNNYEIKTKNNIEISQEIKNDEQKKALIRGAFLGAGTITNPESVYHLEIAFEKEEYANLIKNILEEMEISSKIIKRDNKNLLYIEDGDNISKFLAFIGANKSVLKFEDTRVMKDVRNNINRLVNCETANLNKTINSAVKQIDKIKLIKSKKRFKELSEKEQQLAELRLKNPHASLVSLGSMLTPPLSKSGVNHRMNSIMKFADKLTRGDE